MSRRLKKFSVFLSLLVTSEASRALGAVPEPGPGFAGQDESQNGDRRERNEVSAAAVAAWHQTAPRGGFVDRGALDASPEAAAFDNVAFEDENKRRRAAATDCSKFKRKKCTKKEQCKYEQGACVAKSSCEKKTKKGKCKKDADCTWKNDEKSCVDAVPDCSDYAKKGQCNEATGCKWKKQACVKDPGSESGAITDGGDSFDSACADSTTWRKKNKDKQNCAWVGKKAAKRCKAKVKSEDGVKAKVACPMACGTCDPADDKIAALEAENAALAAELEEAVADKTEAQGNVTTLEAKNAALEAENAELEAAKASGEGCPTPAPTPAPTPVSYTHLTLPTKA